MTRRRRGKPIEEWSPAYRRRIENYLRRNPWATLSDARGHKKTPPPDKDMLELTKWNLQQKRDSVHIREKLGLITREEADKRRHLIDQMVKGTERIWAKEIPGTSSYNKERKKLSRIYKEMDAAGMFHEEEPYNEIFYGGGK